MTDIYIATHKQIQFPLPNCYKWVQVNAAQNGEWDNYYHDNDFCDNISVKNDSYCELTALYQLWKHSNADIKGLCHYRRFFGKSTGISINEYLEESLKRGVLAHKVINEKRIKHLLKNNDIIVTHKLCPFPLTAFEDLERFVYLEDIRSMITVINCYYPDYCEALYDTLESLHISYCNMFISSNSLFDQYCDWLFGVIGHIEKETDISGYDKGHKRLFGYLAEVLLNVYIKKHHLVTSEVDILTLDEDPTPDSLKRQFFILKQRFLAFLGIVPKREDRLLWKTRFHHYHQAVFYPKANDSINTIALKIQQCNGIDGHFFEVCGHKGFSFAIYGLSVQVFRADHLSDIQQIAAWKVQQDGVIPTRIYTTYRFDCYTFQHFLFLNIMLIPCYG